MAFPVVETADTQQGAQGSNSSSWTVTYPTNLASGDLILFVAGVDGTTQSGSATGFTKIGEMADGDGAAVHAVILARESDGTESGNFTFSPGASEQGGWACFRITGWYGGTISSGDPLDGTNLSAAYRADAAGSPSTNAPLTTHNPTNWGAEDTLWMGLAAFDGNVGISTYPTTFTISQVSQTPGSSTGALMSVAFDELNAVSSAAGTFVATASQEWVTIVLGIRPGTGTQTITLGLLDAGPALYAPTVIPDQFITLDLLDSGSALYAPTLSQPVDETITFVDATSVVATGSQTTLVVPVPAGVADGDLLLMAVYLTATSGSITSPGGWNVLYANDVAGSSTSSHSSLFWRIASSEPADYTITTTSGRSAGGMIALRGVLQSDPIDASSSAPDTTADLSVIASAVTATAHEMIVFFGGGRLLPNGSGWTASQPTGMTEVEDASSTVAAVSNSGIAIDYEYVDAGSTGTRTSTITTATTVNWIAYLVALNPDDGSSLISLPLLDASPALYAPTVSPGPVGISLGLLDGAPALYAPTVTPTNLISLGLLDGAPALYAPTLLTKNLISLGLLDGAPALYALTVTPTNLISLGLIDSASALYAPTLVVGPAALTLPLLDAGSALYAPTILPGPVTVSLGLLDSGSALYAPTLLTKNLISLGLLDASPALYAPTIVQMGGLQSISLDLLDAGSALYAPTLLTKNLLTVPLLTSTSALYAPTLLPTNALTLGLLDAGNALYAPTLLTKNLISLGLLDAASALYAPEVIQLAPGFNIFLVLLDSGPALYAPIIAVEEVVAGDVLNLLSGNVRKRYPWTYRGLRKRV